MIARGSDGGIGRERLSPRVEDDDDLEADRVRRAELRDIEADRRHDIEAIEGGRR
jgi:hypothetical protein